MWPVVTRHLSLAVIRGIATRRQGLSALQGVTGVLVLAIVMSIGIGFTGFTNSAKPIGFAWSIRRRGTV